MSKAPNNSQSWKRLDYLEVGTTAEISGLDAVVGQVVELKSGDRYEVSASDKGAGILMSNGLYANPAYRTINVAAYGYDNAGVTAAISAAKALAGSLGDQYPATGQLTLYFPAGVYNSGGTLIDLVVGATGFNIQGEGFNSQLENIQITMAGGARCSIGNFMMRGALGYGINSNSSGAFLSRQNCFSKIYIRDKTQGVIINGSTWNSWNDMFIEKSTGDGWQVLDTSGEQVSNCYSVSNDGKGVYVEKGGEFKTSNFSIHNNAGYGVHLYGDDTNTVVENYFEGLTSTIQQRTRLLTITSIVTHPDGIQVTTSAAHELAAGMDDVNVTGTTNYNGNHSVVTVIDSTNFTLDVAYVANEATGQIDLPNWDLVVESDSAFNYRVNDQFFSGGNINYAKIKGYNIRFDDVRLKKQFFVEAPSNLIFRKGSLRGRQTSPFDDVVTSGITDGVFESVLSDNNGSSSPGTASMRFTGGGNELSVGPDGSKGSALYSGNTGDMSDDTVYSFTPPVPRGAMKVTNGLGQNSRVIDVTFDTVAGTTALAGYQGAAIDRTNGALTGTTGVDGQITISAANDGKIYLENRNGSQKLWWTIIR